MMFMSFIKMLSMWICIPTNFITITIPLLWDAFEYLVGDCLCGRTLGAGDQSLACIHRVGSCKPDALLLVVSLVGLPVQSFLWMVCGQFVDSPPHNFKCKDLQQHMWTQPHSSDVCDEGTLAGFIKPWCQCIDLFRLCSLGVKQWDIATALDLGQISWMLLGLWIMGGFSSNHVAYVHLHHSVRTQIALTKVKALQGMHIDKSILSADWTLVTIQIITKDKCT